MGIASGIFWIMAGVLYVLYRAFKEHPSETISGVIICAVLVGGIIGFTCLYRWMMDQNVLIGSIFAFGVLGIICAWFGRLQYKEKIERDKQRQEYENWMNKVRATMTEKDYENYAKVNCWRFNANMNPNSVLYWKKEPYYQKIKSMAELTRSIEMKKTEGKKQIQ